MTNTLDRIETAVSLAFEGEGEAWSDKLSGDRLAYVARRAIEDAGIIDEPQQVLAKATTEQLLHELRTRTADAHLGMPDADIDAIDKRLTDATTGSDDPFSPHWATFFRASSQDIRALLAETRRARRHPTAPVPRIHPVNRQQGAS